MSEPSADLARRRLHRSLNTLLEADALIERAQYHGAVNRLYYAAFYAARSLLATRDLESSKHSRAIALFQLHFVKTGEVPIEVARVLQQSFDARQLADYSDYTEPALGEVSDLRSAVARFVTFCEEWLDRHPGHSSREEG
jgi:uncharacterized protein (UPF0332 family)